MANSMLEKASDRMPKNLEAERAVLGCILQDNSVIDEVFATISYNMFYDFLHQAVFESIGELRREGLEADKITVKDQAITTARLMSEKVDRIRAEAKRRDGVTEDSLTDNFFAEILEDAAFATNVMSYCNIIKEKYVLREAIKRAQRIIVECQTEEKNADEICNNAQDDFYRLSASNDDKSFVRADELTAKVFEELEIAIKSVDGITGIKTGFKELDSMTSGLQRTDMIILAGRPGMGKTTFALNLASKICNNDYSIAFFSLEMTDAQLVKKILADASGVSNTDMRSGRVSDEGMKDLLEAARKLDKKKLFINDNSYLTIPDLRNKCMKLKNSKDGLDIVFIDYLQLMHAGENYRNSNNSKNGFASRQEEIAEISRNIKGLAKELNVPIVALSQLSREVESRKSQIPQLSDIRESGAIEQDADIVMFLSKPDKEGLDGSIDLIIAKHRNGNIGTINFKFDKATSSFEEWDKSGIEAG